MTHLKIEQNNSAIEQVSSAVITKLYELATSGELDQSSNLVGRLHTDATYQQYIDRIRNNYPDLYITSDKTYFAFQDPEVLRLMSTTFGDGNGVTDLQLLNISSLNDIFKENTDIVSFNELKDITGVTVLGYTEFLNCSNLESIDLRNIVDVGVNGGIWECYTFNGCSNLTKNSHGILHLPKLTRVSGKIFGHMPYLRMLIVESLIYFGKPNFIFDYSDNILALIAPKSTMLDENNSLRIAGDNYHPNTIFGYSSYMSVIELGKITQIEKLALQHCSALRAVVLHLQDTVPALQGYSSGNSFTQWLPNANCNIFVPDNIVATIQADSTWSNFSSHVKPISEYDFSDYIDDIDLVNYYNSVFNT